MEVEEKPGGKRVEGRDVGHYRDNCSQIMKRTAVFIYAPIEEEAIRALRATRRASASAARASKAERYMLNAYNATRNITP